jgi:hypothetical protein
MLEDRGTNPNCGQQGSKVAPTCCGGLRLLFHKEAVSSQQSAVSGQWSVNPKSKI